MYLEILENIQSKICNIIGTDLVSLLHSLYYPRQLAFSIYIFIAILLIYFPRWYVNFMNLSVVVD